MTRIAAAAFTIALMTVACDSAERLDPSPAVETQMSARELGRVGAEIRKSPERADEILREHGMTAESLEVEVRRVAADPDQSKAYREAFDAELSPATPAGG